MKRVGIRELKESLSRYLREAERGEAIEVTDRGRVIAVIRSPEDRSALSPQEQRYRELVAQGAITPAKEQFSWGSLLEGPPLLGPGESLAILDELRDE